MLFCYLYLVSILAFKDRDTFLPGLFSLHITGRKLPPYLFFPNNPNYLQLGDHYLRKKITPLDIILTGHYSYNGYICSNFVLYLDCSTESSSDLDKSDCTGDNY